MSSRLMLLFGLLVVSVTGTAGCSGHGHEGMVSGSLSLEPATSDVRLADADVFIGGNTVDASTIPAGYGDSTLFTVGLADPEQGPRIARVQMEYRAHSGMGTMGSWSSVDCYDDGSHGDQVAGDGTYSYMDMDRHIGVHYQDCTSGEYRFVFHGTDLMENHTNSVVARVTVR